MFQSANTSFRDDLRTDILWRVFVTLILILHALHLLIGLADSGDSYRSTSFLIERPVGFADNLPDINSPEGRRRFLTHWLDQWVLLEPYPQLDKVLTFSSYKLYLYGQVLISSLLTGDAQVYSVMAGSLLSRVLYVSGWLLLLLELRRLVRASYFWPAAALISVVSLDASFTAYLNSFYEEQMGIILLPLMAWMLYRAILERSHFLGWGVLAMALFIATAKIAFFVLPLLVAPFLSPLFRGRWPRAGFLGVVLLAQALALLPVMYGKYVKANEYHALYYGALMVMPPGEVATLGELGGKAVLPECVGVSSFHPGGESCLSRAEASYLDVLRLFAQRPQVMVDVMGRLIGEGQKIGIDYLGKALPEGAPDLSQVPVFNLWGMLYAHSMNVLIVLLALTTAYLRWRGSRPGNAHVSAFCGTGIFLAAVGVSQYGVALGDGFFEINRHLLVGNYALSMALIFLLAGHGLMFMHGRSGATPG